MQSATCLVELSLGLCESIQNTGGHEQHWSTVSAKDMWAATYQVHVKQTGRKDFPRYSLTDKSVTYFDMMTHQMMLKQFAVFAIHLWTACILLTIHPVLPQQSSM